MLVNIVGLGGLPQTKKLELCQFCPQPVSVDNLEESCPACGGAVYSPAGVVAEFGSLTAAQLMEKVRGLQNLAYQLGLEEGG